MPDIGCCQPIQSRINGVYQTCVDARLLHQLLQSSMHFLQWFSLNKNVLGLVCHVDYEPIFEELPIENHRLTLTAARLLASNELNDRGREICRHLGKLNQSRKYVSVARENVLKSRKIKAEQKETLKILANWLAHKERKSVHAIWSEIKKPFGLNSYHDLSEKDFEAAYKILNRPPKSNLDSDKTNYQSERQELPRTNEVEEAIEHHTQVLWMDLLPFLKSAMREHISALISFYEDPEEALYDEGYIRQLLSESLPTLESCLALVRCINRLGIEQRSSEQILRARFSHYAPPEPRIRH